MFVTHIFYGTNFALWKNHMLDYFRAKGPKFWWVVTSGLTHVLDHRNLTSWCTLGGVGTFIKEMKLELMWINSAMERR